MVQDGYPDALPFGRARGRGAALNPGNRFDGLRLHVLGETLDEVAVHQPPSDQAGRREGRQVPSRFFADHTRRLLNRVDSPDLPFHWTLNPYRGCEHGCAYCYARPTHEMLGLSCGLDFESKILVKHDAPGLLRRELASPRWKAEPIAMSGVTDCYQPIEARLRITRGCLEVLAACRQPVGIVTKNRLVVRDTDLLRELAVHDAASVTVSLTTLDPGLSASMEPRASCPADRLRAIEDLARARIPVAAMIAPVIPGLNDHEIPALLEAAAAAGARSATWMMLRLPHQVKDVFLDWLRRHAPLRAGRVEQRIRDVRGGELSDSRFGRRMRGEGAIADHIASTMDVFRRRHGLDRALPVASSAAFRRPEVDDAQLTLFADAG
jgi:DNA repair photolyase